MLTFELLKRSYTKNINQLSEWRGRYETKIYPGKVVLNLFYDLYTLKEVWSSLESAFSGDLYDVLRIPKEKLSILINKNYSNDNPRLLEVLKELNQKFEFCRVNTIRPVLMKLMEDNIPIGDIEYKKFKKLIEGASNNSSLVEEIEYEYFFYQLVIDMIMLWSAYGCLGYDRISASIATTGMVIGDFNFRNLEKTISSFSHVSAVMTPRFMNG